MKHAYHRVALAGALGAGLLLVASGAPAAAEKAAGEKGQSPAARGHVIFTRQCAPCHGAGPGDDGTPQLPGTAALARKYKGEQPGELEKRKDLNADILRAFVRNGVGPMPMFRKAELSDRDIDDIAAYLKASAAAR